MALGNSTSHAPIWITASDPIAARVAAELSFEVLQKTACHIQQHIRHKRQATCIYCGSARMGACLRAVDSRTLMRVQITGYGMVAEASFE